MSRELHARKSRMRGPEDSRPKPHRSESKFGRASNLPAPGEWRVGFEPCPQLVPCLSHCCHFVPLIGARSFRIRHKSRSRS